MELSILNGWLKGGRSNAEAGSAPQGGAADMLPGAADAASRQADQSPDRFRLLKWFAAASFVAVALSLWIAWTATSPRSNFRNPPSLTLFQASNPSQPFNTK